MATELPPPLTEIRSLCQRYSHSGVSPGAHALAYRILMMIEKHEKATVTAASQTERMEANVTEEKTERQV